MLISILTVLSILTAVSSLTVVFIHTVVYILTVVSSLSVHTQSTLLFSCYFHVIFISAYPAARVKFYAYVHMLDRNDLITNLLFAEKESSLQASNYAKGKNQCKNNTNDSFGKGFHVLKDHMLNRLMTGRCPRTSLQLRLKFHSLFLQNSFDFQKSATFIGLKSSPRMYMKSAPSPEWKSDRLTDR